MTIKTSNIKSVIMMNSNSVCSSIDACLLPADRTWCDERNEIQSVLNWTHLVFYKYFHRCPFLDGYSSLCYKPRPIHVRFIHTIYRDGGNGSASKLSSNHQNKKKKEKKKKTHKIKEKTDTDLIERQNNGQSRNSGIEDTGRVTLYKYQIHRYRRENPDWFGEMLNIVWRMF